MGLLSTVSFHDNITPLLITYDEAPNLGRTLPVLDWAKKIVVVDSGSTDGTLEMLGERRQVRVLHREFDSFARQCAFGLESGEVDTEWVLSLDADHVLTPELIEELGRIEPGPTVAGYRAGFTYCIHGRPLRGSLYPARIVLFRRSRGRYVDDGHGHHVEVEGEVGDLRGRILHDDRKSLSRWLEWQGRYARAEVEKLTTTAVSELSLPDRLRRYGVIAPFAVLFYCLFIKRGILDGRAGWHYAFQRMIAELILSLFLLDHRLSSASEGGTG